MSTADMANGQGKPGRVPEHDVPLRRNMLVPVLWIGQATSSLGVLVADVPNPLASSP